MNKEMAKRLNSYVGSDTLISIYSEVEDPDSFSLGYILHMDNNYILMNMVSAFGEENGFCAININKIFIFDFDKSYAEKMQKLFEIKKQQRRYVDNLETDTLESFLKFSACNNFIVEVNEDDDYMGYVSAFSKDTLELKLIDNYCNDMGMAVIDMNNVNVLKCQNKYLKDLELLISN